MHSVKWEQYITEGDQYLKTAVHGWKNRRHVFTTEIVYNIVSMAIEKHIMGYLLFNDRLPDNHTLTDLASAMDMEDGMDAKLQDQLVQMDRFQHICSLDAYQRMAPGEDEIKILIDIGEQIRTLVVVQLGISPLSQA